MDNVTHMDEKDSHIEAGKVVGGRDNGALLAIGSVSLYTLLITSVSYQQVFSSSPTLVG